MGRRWPETGRVPGGGEFRRPAALNRAGRAVPPLMLVASFDDGLVPWLHAGQAMQRVLLTATLAGLDAGFWSAAVEVPSVRRELRELAGGAVWPQALLAIGRGRAAKPSPRRDLDEVLIEWSGGAVRCFRTGRRPRCPSGGGGAAADVVAPGRLHGEPAG
ncbi:hypothetical protein GCM10027258_40380 [Amycolatopsis stemonae]